MDRTDLDQLTAIADRRAAAAHVASTQLRKVADDFMAVATGYVGFRHAADALDAMGEADRALAAVFRRLALAARRPADDEVPGPARRAPGDDWRQWTEEDFPDDDGAPDDTDLDGGAGPDGRATAGDAPQRPAADDWDDGAPLVADIRLGGAPG